VEQRWTSRIGKKVDAEWNRKTLGFLGNAVPRVTLGGGVVVAKFSSGPRKVTAEGANIDESSNPERLPRGLGWLCLM